MYCGGETTESGLGSPVYYIGVTLVRPYLLGSVFHSSENGESKYFPSQSLPVLKFCDSKLMDKFCTYA